MAVNESGALAAALPDAGLALDAIVVNGLNPRRFSAAELRRIDEVRSGPSPAGPPKRPWAAALTEAGRVKAQHAELERLRQLVPASFPLTELPFLFSADFGTDELELLAGEIS